MISPILCAAWYAAKAEHQGQHPAQAGPILPLQSASTPEHVVSPTQPEALTKTGPNSTLYEEGSIVLRNLVYWSAINWMADPFLGRDRKALPLFLAYRPSEWTHQRGFSGKKSQGERESGL